MLPMSRGNISANVRRIPDVVSDCVRRQRLRLAELRTPPVASRIGYDRLPYRQPASVGPGFAENYLPRSLAGGVAGE